MAFQDSSLMDESLPPPEASPTRPPATRGFDPSANPPLPPSDQPRTDDQPPVENRPPRYASGQHDLVDRPPGTEPYIPSRHDYPHTQWGDDDFILRGARKYPGILQSPYMPQERDFASLLHNTVMWFGRFGSPHVAIPAIAMGNYASAYWTAYQKGMHERAGTAWQQYQHAQRMMLDRQKQELMEAREIVALYKDDPHRFEQEMRTLSAKYGDDKYLNAAIEKGPAAVEAWMAAKNGKYLDAAKAAQQQRAADDLHKTREQEYQLRAEQEKRRQRAEQEHEQARKRLEDERRRIDPNAPPVPLSAIPAAPAEPPITSTAEPPAAEEGGGEEGGGEEGSPSDAMPDAASTSPDAMPDETPGAKPAGLVQTADASGTVPIGGGGQTRGVEPSDVLKELAAPAGKPETPFLEEAGKASVFTGKMPDSLKKKGMEDLLQRAEARGQQYKNWLDSLEGNRNLTPNQIKEAVKRQFPQLGDTLEGYLAGDLAPQNPRTNPMWARVYSLARRVDPGFSQGTFNSRQTAIRFWTNGQGGTTLTSNGQVIKHLTNLLNDLPNKPLPYTGWLDRWTGIEGYVTKDFENQITTVNQEYARALSGKGGTIPELKEQSEELHLNMTEGAMRANIESKLRALKVRLEQLKDAFNTSTGWPRQDILDRFDRYTASNPTATNEEREAAQHLKRFDGQTAHNPLLDEARRAIAHGASRDLVIKRLREMGGDPGGL